MADRDGAPIWYELMTDAPDAAESFYGAVMGWRFETTQGAMGRDYRIFTAADGEPVGGLVKAPDGACFAQLWAVYFSASDVDAAAEKVAALGGAVDMEPQDIPGVGRLAFVADPQGARFYLMRVDADAGGAAFAPKKPGHCVWNELAARDQKAALAFYGALFGWEKAGAMPMGGGMGDYTFIKNGETEIGAMMDAPEDAAAPLWNFAFQVPDIDGAKAAIEAGGGTIRHGPLELPVGGDWLIQATDPQGARVMFTGARERGAA